MGTDKNGYNNQKVPEKRAILLMGSSHMEAFNAAQDKNTATLLQEMLNKDGMDDQVYDIGISGHHFLKCLSNLENAMEVYQLDNKYAIIETFSLSFTEEDLEFVNGMYPLIPSNEHGFLGMLQRFR